MVARVANCPNCGGQVEFKAGRSLLSVCPYCSSAVARVGDDITELEILGQVAPLADIESPLSVGASGKYKRKSFTIVGRVQLNYGAGPWNEWYAAFDDGNWGWIAEAQGKIYLTFGKDLSKLPTFGQARVGSVFKAGNMRLTIVERRRAKFVAAEGELPFAVAPNSYFYYADVEGEEGIFGTLDYGDQQGEAEMLFLGEQLDYSDLFDKSVLKDMAPGQAAGSVGMNCPNCGAGVELRAPDESQRVTCVACDSLLDCSKGKELYLLSSAKRGGPEPLIPLGSTGRLEGNTYTIHGHLVRSVSYEGMKYTWEEYLLHGKGVGYRWLVCSDNHWTFVEPVSSGAVMSVGRVAAYKGKEYRHFQSGSATVESLRGEFYWKVAVGERVGTVDYIKPPYVLSKEMSSEEINWSMGTYTEPSVLQEAFKLESALPRPIGVAPNMPNPHGGPLKLMLATGGVFTVLLALIAGLLALMADGKIVLDQDVPLVSAKTWGKAQAKKAGRGRAVGDSVVSQPFDLDERSNLAIKVNADVNNSWLYLGGTLVNETTQEVKRFGAQVSYHSGQSGTDTWSRGGRTRIVYLGGVTPGRYSLQLLPEWGTLGKAPSRYKIQVKSDIFIGSHFLVFLFLLWLVPLLGGMRYYTFEKRRWAESDHAEWS